MELQIYWKIKLGKKWVERAEADEDDCVNSRVVHKLGVAVPPEYLILKYLEAIAVEHKVDWTAPASDEDEEPSDEADEPAGDNDAAEDDFEDLEARFNSLGK